MLQIYDLESFVELVGVLDSVVLSNGLLVDQEPQNCSGCRVVTQGKSYVDRVHKLAIQYVAIQ